MIFNGTYIYCNTIDNKYYVQYYVRMDTTVITSKGTTTIPKSVRTLLNLEPGSKINFVAMGNKVIIEKSLTLEDVRSVNKKYIKQDMLNISIEEARKIAEKAKVKEYQKECLN